MKQSTLTFYLALPVLIPLFAVAVIGCIVLAIVAEWVEAEFYEEPERVMRYGTTRCGTRA